MATVDHVLIDLPALPGAALDVVQDEAGYSAELSVERPLSMSEFELFSDACLRLPPRVLVDGPHEVRGLVSVDDDALWVYVHEVGPGRFLPEREHAAFLLLEQLWQSIHEAAASR